MAYSLHGGCPDAAALATLAVITAVFGTLLATLGIAGRLVVIPLFFPIGFDISTRGLTWANGLALVAALSIALFGTGPYTLWRPEEALLVSTGPGYRRAHLPALMNAPAPHRKQLVRLLLWLAALLLLLLVLRSVPLADTWAALRGLTVRQILTLAAVNLLILGLLNARWWLLLRGQGHPVPFLPLFGYRLATFGVSYFTPGPHFGGEPLQVYLVEKEQQVPRATAVAAMTLDKSLELLVNFLFLLAGVTLIVQQRLLSGTSGMAVLILVGILLLLPAAYLGAVSLGRSPLSGAAQRLSTWSVWQRRPGWHGRLSAAAEVLEGSEIAMARFMRGSPWALLLAFVVSLLSWLLMIGEFWLMTTFLGAPLTAVQLVTALTAARLAILLFLPGGLGVLEASQVVAFTLVGLNPAIGISVGLLIRARDVLLGALGLWWGGRKLAQIRADPAPANPLS